LKSGVTRRQKTVLARSLEGPIMRSVLEYVRYHPKVAKAWRQNSGAVKIEDRYVRFSDEVGIPDICGFLKDGRALYIECKAPKGRLTYWQTRFLELARRRAVSRAWRAAWRTPRSSSRRPGYDPAARPRPAAAGARAPPGSGDVRAAAARVQAPTIAAKVLAELANGPGTTHELAARLGMSLVTVSPRMKPLEAANRVERAGERDGRTVWKAK
jgi:hypothetical protein